jgi:hypothetical protein
MKSVVALLVVVAVCNAAIVKDGGLKGSWADTLAIESTLDVAAPMVDYYSAGYSMFDFETDDVSAYSCFGTYPSYYSNDFDFAVTNEDRFSEGGAVDVSFWMTVGTGDAAVTYMLPTECYIYSDTHVSCTIYYGCHAMAGVYEPTITLTDEVGNWATYTKADFTDVDNPATFTITNTNADTMKPVISSVTVSDLTVTLPTTADDYSDYAFTDITAMIYDTTATSGVATYDANHSGVAAAWVYLSTDNGVTEWSEALMYNSMDDNEVQTWGIRLAFANWAETGTWTVLRVTAMDFANNWADEKAVDQDVVITWSHDSADDVMSCQTLEFNDLSSDLTVDTSYAIAYFTAGCTEKYTGGDNYVYVSFATPEFLAVGDTRKSTFDITSYGYAGLMGATATTYLGNTIYATVPGADTGGDIGYVYMYAYPGYPGTTEGDYTLHEVITFTESGLVQYYTSDQGAASAVVPSVLAVLVAAIVAMLRL